MKRPTVAHLVLLVALLATTNQIYCQEDTTKAPEAIDQTDTASSKEDLTPVEASSDASPAEPAAAETPTEAPTSEEIKPESDTLAVESKVEEERTGTEQPIPNTEAPETSKTEKNGNEEVPSESNPQEPKVFIIHHHYRDPLDLLNGRNYPISPQPYGQPRYPMSNLVPPSSYQPEQLAPQPKNADPLGQFSDSQKKRQFYQDLLMTQLSRFESEIETMVEKESNMTEKNDMEEVLGTVKDLKTMLENHQVFNISEMMNMWKKQEVSNETPMQMQPRPNVMRTLLLVPQQRVIPHFVPQYPQQQGGFGQEPLVYFRRRSPMQTLFYEPSTSSLQSDQSAHRQGGRVSGDQPNHNQIYAY